MQGVRAICLFAVGLSFFANDVAHAVEPALPALREELIQMAARDQDVRNAGQKGDFSKWREIDTANEARLKHIVGQYGWPTFSMIGVDGAHAAWLLAQHVDSDSAFQRKVLALMEPMVQQKQASGKDYAYLYDRTHYPQRFGTQGSCVSHQEWQPFEIEDIVHVDDRRHALGMSSLAAYARLFDCSNPNFILHSPSDPKRTVPVPQSDTAAIAPAELADAALAKQILSMEREDQRVRSERFPLHANEEKYVRAMREVDQRNELALRKIFAERGWPSEKAVGKEGVHAFWLLVQHYPPLLKEALPQMEVAARSGALPKEDLAKSVDRILVLDGKPQRYGTQFKLIAGELVPDPIEDRDHLDERRTQMGMDSYEAALAALRAEYLGLKK
jgi:hypothetical protein